jgi:hypothetical protein
MVLFIDSAKLGVCVIETIGEIQEFGIGDLGFGL